MAQPLIPKLLLSALSVRNSCALQLLAITWQSHVSLQVVKNARYTYSEKAGVGGSTPSLATIFQRVQPGDMGYRMYRLHG